MNKPNNKRKKESQTKIEKVFVELLQTKDINEITVSDICKKTGLNRSTFYANYIDIYDLADKIRTNLTQEVINNYKEEQISKKHSYNFLKLFYHIKENQIFYNTYFKLGFDSLSLTDSFPIEDEELIRWYGKTENGEYHITFFKAGLNAVIKKWLKNGCIETPEQIEEIIKSEYKNKSQQ